VEIPARNANRGRAPLCGQIRLEIRKRQEAASSYFGARGSEACLKVAVGLLFIELARDSPARKLLRCFRYSGNPPTRENTACQFARNHGLPSRRPNTCPRTSIAPVP
jgi:hypothetical protein